MRYVALIIALLAIFTMQAAEENYYFEDPAKRELFLELTAELRCPMCQNQNIADSDAMIANDLRRKVYQLINQGYDRQQVVDYMKERYGEFVTYDPPVTPATVWLWVLPVVFILMAAAYVVVSRKQQKSTQDAGIQESLAKADAILEKDE